MRHIAAVVLAMTLAFAFVGAASAGGGGNGESQVVGYLRGVLAQAESTLASAQSDLAKDSADLSSLENYFSILSLQVGTLAAADTFKSRPGPGMQSQVLPGGPSAKQQQKIIQQMADLDVLIDQAVAVVTQDQARVNVAASNVAEAQAALDNALSQGE
jgi:hypothetical protein